MNLPPHGCREAERAEEDKDCSSGDYQVLVDHAFEQCFRTYAAGKRCQAGPHPCGISSLSRINSAVCGQLVSTVGLLRLMHAARTRPSQIGLRHDGLSRPLGCTLTPSCSALSGELRIVSIAGNFDCCRSRRISVSLRFSASKKVFSAFADKMILASHAGLPRRELGRCRTNTIRKVTIVVAVNDQLPRLRETEKRARDPNTNHNQGNDKRPRVSLYATGHGRAPDPPQRAAHAAGPFHVRTSIGKTMTMRLSTAVPPFAPSCIMRRRGH